MNKIKDPYLHVFFPTGLWGDQFLGLFSCHYHMKALGKQGIVIHTSRNLFDAHHKRYINTTADILKFWSTFDTIKSVHFDLDQRYLIEDVEKCLYEIFGYIDVGYDDNYKSNLADFIDFSLFPDSNLKISGSKIAVFQPLSLKNKPSELVNDYICEWSESVKQLLEKKYKIYLIGSKDNLKECEKLYPFLFNNFNIINLMGKISMFEAINLIMNKADFVLSCCSWAGWCGISSRKKTAIAVGPLMEKGKTDERYVNLIRNKDIFYMDYSSKKEQSDKDISRWIEDNA
tara:strand:- start:2464 stop:3324 length:861 start_codon:yes stop_codon:yes gene_type:complete